jgi:hypothetical protein
MKRIFLLSMLCFFGWTAAQAQIPDGSIAPDFTATDIDGVSHNLYDLLNAGKTVYLDVSATWCGPCWNYHNSHAFRDLWEAHGPDGTDEAYCFYIEGDAATNTACLYGPSGCVGGTQGDWVTGTPYPIIDDAGIASAYQIAYYPTIFCICPADKKVYEAGQISASALWAFRASHCAPPPVEYALTNTRNVRCVNTSTGAINITPGGGNGTYTYLWSNGAVTEDLNNIPAGIYTVTITSGGQSFVSDPIEVLAPALPLSAEVLNINPVGCNGVTGSITVSGIGGWQTAYTYQWQNGQNTETATGLSAGLHKVTVTDAEGCTTVLVQNLAPAVYPFANIETPAPITCSQSTVQLDGSASDSGDDFTYQWFASSGGHIVSGATTTTPIVDADGNYTLQVTNTITTCATFLTVSVTTDQSLPSANAGPEGIVSCPVPVDTLQGSGSTGSSYAYTWSGGNVISGGNTLAPVVGAPGVYTLTVTNWANGCTQTSTTTVTGFNTPPTVNTTGGTLTCGAGSVTLTTSTNSNTPTFTWTGPNGYSSNLQSPAVGTSGSYNVVVNDSITGCSNAATAIITANNTAPGATASAGSLTCVLSNVVVVGTTPDTNATYTWTGPNGFASSLPNFTVAVEGQYNLVVTDPDNGCTSTASAAIASNTTPPTASALSPGNLNCNTAQLQLNGTGSAQGANISYAWTTSDGHIVSGESSQTPLVDAAGSYSIQVTNADNGCTATAGAVVIQSQAVAANVTVQNNVLCNGSSNGSATVAGSGGNGTFSYAWSTGETTESVSNLAAGFYVVSLTDGENCTASTSVVIAQPAILSVNATTIGQSMSGVNDGSATANPTGGTADYTYHWSNDSTSQTIAGLAPGAYTVTVTDLNGCSTVETVNVNSFDCSLSTSISSTNISCFGAENGAATVDYIGGTEPLTFNWSNGPTTQAVTGLAEGTYTVIILDANNCPASLNVTIQQPAPLTANATTTGESFTGANDGTASANPTGGSGAYTYFWNNGAATQNIADLAPGTYTVTVTDVNGCETSQTVVVNTYSCAISTNSTTSPVTCAGAANGSVTVVLNGGTAPFNYAWSNGGSDATITNLSGGTYIATITDDNACSVIVSATVNEPAPFSNLNIEIVQPSCPNEATGSAVVTLDGGTAPYNYLWNNGATGNTLANVTAGNYSVQVTDANGCTNLSLVAILSNDVEAPTVSAQNAVVTLDNSGNVVITLATINAQFADNCGVASTVISPNSFSCSQIGEQVVTLTVTDLSGLTSIATATVKVVDNEAPVVTCPNSIVVCPSNNLVNYQPAIAQDNCLALSGQWSQTSGLPSPSEFPVGTTVQTFIFTDASGNVGSCSFSVTVTPPVIFGNTSITNDHNGLGQGAIDINFTGGVAPYQFSWELGDVVIATTEDISGLVHGNYDLVVTDAQGCNYSLNGVPVGNFVSAKEPTWLNGVSLQPNPTSELANVVFATPLTSRLEISVVDATGRVLKSLISEQAKTITIDCADLPSGLYSVRFRSNQEIGTRKLMVIK